MIGIITELRSAAKKRAAYLRTKAELKNMPLEVAIDLDLYPPHAGKIAHQAVYGA